jgi:hypothetical protein
MCSHSRPGGWFRPVTSKAFTIFSDDIGVDLSHEPTRLLWVEAMIEKHGEYLDVPRLPDREPRYDTPIADAIEMMGDPTKVIVHEVHHD